MKHFLNFRSKHCSLPDIFSLNKKTPLNNAHLYKTDTQFKDFSENMKKIVSIEK